MVFRRLRRLGGIIRKDVVILWFAFRDPQTPWWCKLMAVALVFYGISPVDLIPDFIPFIGILDDAVILPVGVTILLRLLPREVRERSAQKAAVQRTRGKKVVRFTGLVVLIWLIAIVYLVKHYAM